MSDGVTLTTFLTAQGVSLDLLSGLPSFLGVNAPVVVPPDGGKVQIHVVGIFTLREQRKVKGTAFLDAVDIAGSSLCNPVARPFRFDGTHLSCACMWALRLKVKPGIVLLRILLGDRPAGKIPVHILSAKAHASVPVSATTFN